MWDLRDARVPRLHLQNVIPGSAEIDALPA